MAKTNVKTVFPSVKTHEGGKAEHGTALKELRRTLSTCMLWEDTFYESGDSIAGRLMELAGKVTKEQLIAETLRAKNEMHLRHAPLWMARHLTKLHQGKQVGDTITAVIQRADELAEFVSLYYKTEGRKPLSKQAKRGLAQAFGKFNEYQFAKYDRDGGVKLRDAMFLSHPKPTDEALYKRIAERGLATPDTWEVAMSAAKSDEEKRSIWERLMKEDKLGALALLRNLRNMDSVGVAKDLVITALSKMKVEKILPFQFVAAWRYAPWASRAIEDAMLRAASTVEKLPGNTILVVDVSGSMEGMLSGKSDMNRIDAAGALAVALAELSDNLRVWTFSTDVKEVPAARGFGLIGAIANSQAHNGTYLEAALEKIAKKMKGADRVIVITDDQTQDGIMEDTGAKRQFLVNVAPYKNGVDTQGKWTRVSGFSTAIVDWIRQEEHEPLFS